MTDQQADAMIREMRHLNFTLRAATACVKKDVSLTSDSQRMFEILEDAHQRLSTLIEMLARYCEGAAERLTTLEREEPPSVPHDRSAAQSPR